MKGASNKLAKAFIAVIVTVIFICVLYVQISNVSLTISCVSGVHNYGCDVNDLNVTLLIIVAYIIALFFILRWKEK